MLDQLPIATSPAADAISRAPPHPLDGSWRIALGDKTYGPYTGHELKRYLSEGRINGATSVAAEGTTTWVRAAEDPLLASLFQVSSAPPPPAPLTASGGGTVVQVTNNMPNIAGMALLDDGPYGPKSAGLALLFSILLCGGGQMYNGQVAKGILMLVGCIVLWFIFLGWIINIWSWVDAYQTAKKMNARYLRRLAAGMPI